MSSSKILEIFQNITRWVLSGMACEKGCCDNCGRYRSLLMVVLILMCGLVGCICVSCGVEGVKVWRKNEKDSELGNYGVESVSQQFNLSRGQLQALASLLSATDQNNFFDCIEKSVPAKLMDHGFSESLKLLWPEIMNDQGWFQNNILFQDKCLIRDRYVPEGTRYSLPKIKYTTDIFSKQNIIYDKFQSILHTTRSRFYNCEHFEFLRLFPNGLWWSLLGFIFYCSAITYRRKILQSSGQQLKQDPQRYQHQDSKGGWKWRKKILALGVILGVLVSIWIFFNMNADTISRRKDSLANMCDERARMLQDQFNVSMNHVQALGILVSTFHHGKNPSAIDQKTFAEYTARTAFERPLTSGVAYALKVLHPQREEFEKQYRWRIKKMETEDQSPVKDEYMPDKLDPSPVQPEYAPVIFSQETVSHIVSIDMMSGKEDRDNILRARATGKGVLTSPFNLLKSNHLGVVLTFSVYDSDLPPYATPEERINATVGYLGASFDVPSLVEKLLQQLASKQTIIVNVYDTTNFSAPIKMYGPDETGKGEVHISSLDFGDPERKHEMHCRFKQEVPLPWSAVTTSFGVMVIVLLVGHIFHAAINQIEKVEDDYLEMRDLKVRAEAADVAKSQFLATVSHEIRTPMNGVLGMLQMLMDTDLDATQQDFAMTAQSSGKALIALINEVLDQAKIESGRLELEAVPFDVRDVLDNVISLFSDKSRDKRIELAVYISNRVPEIIIGDPGRFRQIITNLVGNSVKFTEEGHIFVSVHLVEEVKSASDINNQVAKQISGQNCTDISCLTLSGFQVVNGSKSWENFKIFKNSTESTDTITLLVVVEDTGVGIPLEAQSRIFMPFMQADSSTSRTYGGTGIGLSISKCLVDLMGGEIGFVSKPGVGSTFAFTAEFREGRKNSVERKKLQAVTAESDFHGMRTLVVDGRCIRAQVTKYHLERLGIQVDIALSPESAVASIKGTSHPSGARPLNMVLVDKEAWGEDSGLAFPYPLTELKQNSVIQHQKPLPKLILLATSLSSAEIDELRSAGYVDCIVKPLRLSSMAACLQKALGVGNKRYLDPGKTTSLGSLLKGKHILVVDDNAVNRKVAACALKKYGALVTCADSGKAALQLLRPLHKFDACFMDVQMPEMDGFEATKQIRSTENKVNEMISSGEASKEMFGNISYWHVPILAMTADVFQATYDECVKCGMDDYVSKPFEEEQLYSAVAHFFEDETVNSVS